MEGAQQSLGEAEVRAGEPGGVLRSALQHRVGERAVLLDGRGADLLGVRLAGEAEGHVLPQPERQLRELRVVGGRRDRLVQLRVGDARGVAVRGLLVGGDGAADAGLVARVGPLGGGVGDRLLDDGPAVDGLLQRAPAVAERAAHHRVGRGSPLLHHEGAAGAAAAHLHVAERDEAGDGLPHRVLAHLEAVGELREARQALPDDELAERERGHEPVRDADRGGLRDQRAERRGRGNGDRDGSRGDGRRAHVASNQVSSSRAIVEADASTLSSSTASSTPWMFRTRGP